MGRNNNVQTKLDTLRDLLPYNQWDENDLRQMEQWQKNITELINEQDYYNLEITQKIVAMAAAQLKAINAQMLTKDVDHKMLWYSKSGYVWIIRLLAKDHEKLLNSIEEEISTEIESIRNLKSEYFASKY